MALLWSNLPIYARDKDKNRLMKHLCKDKCHSTRWGVLNKDYPGYSILKEAKMGEYKLTCLKCGNVAYDNYNWYR